MHSEISGRCWSMFSMADFGNFSQSDKLFKSFRTVEIICFRRESAACHILSESPLSGAVEWARLTLANPRERNIQTRFLPRSSRQFPPRPTAEPFRRTASQAVLQRAGFSISNLAINHIQCPSLDMTAIAYLQYSHFAFSELLHVSNLRSTNFGVLDTPEIPCQRL